MAVQRYDYSALSRVASSGLSYPQNKSSFCSSSSSAYPCSDDNGRNDKFPDFGITLGRECAYVTPLPPSPRRAETTASSTAIFSMPYNACDGNRRRETHEKGTASPTWPPLGGLPPTQSNDLAGRGVSPSTTRYSPRRFTTRTMPSRTGTRHAIRVLLTSCNPECPPSFLPRGAVVNVIDTAHRLNRNTCRR